MPDDRFPRMVDLLADVLMLDGPAIITPTAHLVADLGAESIHVAEIAVAIENEFGIVVTDEALAGVRTVSDLMALVG